MKKIILTTLTLLFSGAALVTGTLAILEETVKLTGTTFNIAANAGQGTGGSGEELTNNAFLKMLTNLSGSTDSSNLADAVVGPIFNDVDTPWTGNALVKLYNKGSVSVDVIAKSDYVSDPDTLRDDIFVAIYDWNDSNHNGALDSGEKGALHKRDTILRLKNDTFPLGSLNATEVKGFVLEFDGSGISSANAGKSAVYDFTFTGAQSAP